MPRTRSVLWLVSAAPLTNEVIVTRVLKALYDLREALEGSHDDPTNEVPGLIKAGDDLAGELHKMTRTR